jgi:hypothetical protein
MNNLKIFLLMLTNGFKSSKTWKKNLPKNRLSIRVRNFAPLNEPLNIFKFFFLF